MKVELPIQVRSETNIKEHWAKKSKRAKDQRTATKAMVFSRLVPLLRITLTRVYPKRGKKMDQGNLGASFKHVQDGVQDALKIDDGSDAIDWVYRQRRCEVATDYSVIVEIESV